VSHLQHDLSGPWKAARVGTKCLRTIQSLHFVHSSQEPNLLGAALLGQHPDDRCNKTRQQTQAGQVDVAPPAEGSPRLARSLWTPVAHVARVRFVALLSQVGHAALLPCWDCTMPCAGCVWTPVAHTARVRFVALLSQVGLL